MIKSVSLRLNCLYNIVYAAYLISLQESGILVHMRQSMPMWLTPNRNPGLLGSGRTSLVYNISFVLSQHVAGGIKQFWCDSNGSFHLVSSSTVHVPFSFDFALYPLAIINLSCEYGYFLSPVNPPSQSSQLSEVLRTPTHDLVNHLFFKHFYWVIIILHVVSVNFFIVEYCQF